MDHPIEILVNKRELMVFDTLDQANTFIDTFTQSFKENIMFSAPRDRHLGHIESTIIFYAPYESQPEGQEVILLDLKLPKEGI